MAKTEPNWEEMSRISDEADALDDQGKLTQEAWLKLYRRAQAAVNGNDEFLEFIENMLPAGAEVPQD